MEQSGQTLKQKFYREMKDFAVLTLYLWMIFVLFLLYKSAILDEGRIPFLAHGFAIINALAFAKVVLIARALHLGEWADEDAPLIYPTLLKSASFSIVLSICKILEAAIVGRFHNQPFRQSLTEIGGGTFKGMLTLTLLLFVVLIPFFGVGELTRVFGEGKLSQLFFRSRELVGQAGEAS